MHRFQNKMALGTPGGTAWAHPVLLRRMIILAIIGGAMPSL